MWCEAAGAILFNASGSQMQGLGWAAMGQVSAQNGSVAGVLFGAWARVSPGAAAVGSRVSRDAALLPGSASRHRVRSGGTRAQGSVMSFAHSLDRKFFLASGRGTMQSCSVRADASQRGLRDRVCFGGSSCKDGLSRGNWRHSAWQMDSI